MAIRNNQLIIMDTSAVISLVSDADSLHSSALAISSHLKSHRIVIIVPGDVFTETANYLGKKLGHKQTIPVCELLYGEDFQIVEATPEIRLHAINLFKNTSESVSYTDCLVMAFVDAYATKTIFGFDKAFRTAGYQLPPAK
jgi:predicted nucleic acid-binding protein